ncbi:hypothetical protein BGZ76_005724, partial [Entomortierella beljakovae]
MNDQHSSKVANMKRHQTETEHQLLVTVDTTISSTTTTTSTSTPDSDLSQAQTDTQSPNSEPRHRRTPSNSKKHSNRSQSNTRQVIRTNIPSKHTSHVSHGRRRRAKFVFGDHDAEEDEMVNQENLQQQQQQQQQQQHREIDLNTAVTNPALQRQGQSEGPPTKQKRPENQDYGHGPNLETIPNSHQRNHPRRIGETSSMEEEDNNSNSSDSSNNNCTIKSIDKPTMTETNSKIELDDSDSNGSKRRLLENAFALQQESQINKDAHTLDRSQDLRDGKGMASQLDLVNVNDNINDDINQLPEITTSIKKSSTAPVHHDEPSKRLFRLLQPSRSTTSLTSITKTISQPVLWATPPESTDSLADDRRCDEGSDSSASISALSATLRSDQAAAITPVVDLVTNFLNPNRSRSRSYTNLSGSNRTHLFNSNLQQRQPPNLGSSGGSIFSPPRANDSTNSYLVSRFLPVSPSHTSIDSSVPKLSASPSSTLSQTFSSSSANALPNKERRRLPAGLVMTSATQSDECDQNVSRSQSMPTTPTTPSRPTTPNSMSSFYSSAEGRPIYDSPESGNQCSSPWNPEESMSRTQQKLMLQKASSLDDMDEQEIARRRKYLREMDRTQKEFRCVNLYADPLLDSLLRCQARYQQEQKLAETQSQAQKDSGTKLALSISTLS